MILLSRRSARRLTITDVRINRVAENSNHELQRNHICRLANFGDLVRVKLDQMFKYTNLLADSGQVIQPDASLLRGDSGPSSGLGNST
jgi:hypothetical protein